MTAMRALRRVARCANLFELCARAEVSEAEALADFVTEKAEVIGLRRVARCTDLFELCVLAEASEADNDKSLSQFFEE